MPNIWTFDHIEKNHTLFHGEDCMKKFRESLTEHTEITIDFVKKKMLPENKRYQKVIDRCYYTGK